MLTEKTDQLAVAYLLPSHTDQEIAARLNVPLAGVAELRALIGPPSPLRELMPHARRIAGRAERVAARAARVSTISELWHAGYTTAAISARMGMKPCAVTALIDWHRGGPDGDRLFPRRR